MFITDSTLWDTLSNVAAVLAFLAPALWWVRKQTKAEFDKLWAAHDDNARRLDEKP